MVLCDIDVVIMKIIICKINNNLVRNQKHIFLINTLVDKLKEYFNISISKDDIVYDKLGKPYIKDNQKKFSFSYSDEIAVIGISDYNLGIDVEKIKQYDEKIVNKIYSKEEFDFINNSKNKDYEYTKLWTYKEAYVKSKGTGIDKNFNKLNFIGNHDYKDDNLFKTINYTNYIITVCSEDTNLEVEVVYDE